MQFSKDISKEQIFSEVESFLSDKGFSIANKDMSRPWGGFFVITESEAELFINTFFPHLSLADFAGFAKLSPKILLVAPGKRLSWQYHFRRSEIWKVIGGNAAIVISETDEETPQKTLPLGTIVELAKGERHRLVGADEWGVIAEIWKHTDASNPSDEDDIVRVQDDFGR
jgi:mannose-6-phosphate isomerase-like protein (cupin superfamily)